MAEKILITNIKQLLTMRGNSAPRAGAAADDIGLIEDCAVLIEENKISALGKYPELKPLAGGAQIIEANGVVAPSFCDCHTHPVFARPRLADFSMRAEGISYADIKKRGGGILSSVDGVRRAGEDELKEKIKKRAEKFLACGTGAIEAKSGYGLSLSAELKSLRALKNAQKETPLEMVPTLLAAHSVPAEFADAKDYAEHIISEIIPAVAEEKLAKFIDVFCEKGFFDTEISERMLREGAKYGLIAKVHAEQLAKFGGAGVAVKTRAISADHIDYIDDDDIREMKQAGVIGVLLPASNYYLGQSKYPPVKEMLAGGLPVALATDFNPGTSPCWNMQFVLSLACINMKMTPAQAFVSATINGAYAMGLGGKTGVIDKGYQADLSIFDADDYREIAYYFGGNICRQIVKNGKMVKFS